MSGFIVALCELQPKDARLLEIVLNRAPNRRFDFRIVPADDAGYADIAIIDADRTTTLETLARLRRDSPELVEVYVSESGAAGNGKYKIAKRSLVLHCFRLLESIAETRMSGSVAAAMPPATQTADEPAAQVRSRPEALTLRGLVVDDSSTVRTQLEVTLQRTGLEVHTAVDGESALERIQVVSYDLVFLDVVMPGINGYELCRKIRTFPSGRHLPVVMLTSRSSPFDRARGALAGCDTYLTKPVTLRDFYQTVHKSLSKRFNPDELASRGYKRQV
jgi:twitching motility two-component system response regulator PilG